MGGGAGRSDRDERVGNTSSGFLSVNSLTDALVARSRRYRRRPRERQRLSGGFNGGRGLNGGDGGSRMVRVDVEERVCLRADEVVTRRRTTAGDTDRLRETEDALLERGGLA